MVLYDMQEGDNTILNNKDTVDGGYSNSQRICTCIHTCIDIYMFHKSNMSADS